MANDDQSEAVLTANLDQALGFTIPARSARGREW